VGSSSGGLNRSWTQSSPTYCSQQPRGYFDGGSPLTHNGNVGGHDPSLTFMVGRGLSVEVKMADVSLSGTMVGMMGPARVRAAVLRMRNESLMVVKLC